MIDYTPEPEKQHPEKLTFVDLSTLTVRTEWVRQVSIEELEEMEQRGELRDRREMMEEK
jgi:hypothetical protein